MIKDSKRTVAVFMANFTGGGVQWCMLRLARELKRRGYAIIFVVMRTKGDLFEPIRQEFEVVNLSADRGFGGAWKSVLPLYRFLKARKPDALIANMKRENMIALLACKIRALPTRLFLVEHTLSSFDRHPIRRCLKIALEKAVLPLLYPLADEVVAVCRSVAEDLERKLGQKGRPVKIVYNPVIPEDLDRLVAARAEHPWLNDPTKDVVLAIGRLRHEKGFSLLIDAFGDVRARRPSARLIIIGDGPERQTLTEKIERLGLKDCVDLPGFKDNVFAWLAASRLFVLPSIWDEPFGLVLVEALASGAPVVSTDGGGPREILDEGKYGVLIPRNDRKALAEAMLKSLETTHDTESLKRRGAFFSVEKSADGYMALLEKTSDD